jgi:hypothetical protein
MCLHTLQDPLAVWQQLMQMCIASDICLRKIVAAFEAIEAAGAQSTWLADISLGWYSRQHSMQAVGRAGTAGDSLVCTH